MTEQLNNEKIRRLAEEAIDSALAYYSGDVAIDVDTFYRPVLDLLAENERLRERDAAAQTLLGLLRHRLIQHGDEAGSKDFGPYRKYQALGAAVSQRGEH